MCYTGCEDSFIIVSDTEEDDLSLDTSEVVCIEDDENFMKMQRRTSQDDDIQVIIHYFSFFRSFLFSSPFAFFHFSSQQLLTYGYGQL